MTQKTKNKIKPKLRFPEFKDAPGWENQTLGSLFFDRQETGFLSLPLLSLTDKEGVIPQDTNNRRDNSSLNKSRYLRVCPGDIVYNTMRMWEGRSAFANLEGIVSPAYTVCKPNNFVDGLFFSYFFKTAQAIKQFRRYSQGLVNDTLNLKYPAFSEISFTTPRLPEQQKIAGCLSSIDELIAGYTQKLDALKDHKIGLMRQLFPAEGKTLPSLRFLEFQNSPEWNVKKLETIADFFKGKGLSKADIDPQGTVPCIRYGELYTIYDEVINNVLSKTNCSQPGLFLSRKHDVIIPASGESKADIATASCVMLDNIALGGDLNIIRSNQNGIFISYYLNGPKRAEIAKIAQGDTVVHLYEKQLKQLDMAFPSKKEQQRIADCLASCDDMISAQTQKLGMLKLHKKGLLQGLFPQINETKR